MSVKRTYACDFCSESESPANDLFGVHWETRGGTYVLVVRGTREVERHLCRGCIEAIKGLDIPRKAQDVY